MPVNQNQMPLGKETSAPQPDFSFLKAHKRKILLVLFILFLFAAGYTYGLNSSRTDKKTITLTGNATIEAPADKVIITGSTYTEGSSVTSAKMNDEFKIADIKKSLLALGLPESVLKIIAQDAYEGTSYPVPTVSCLGSCPSLIPTPTPVLLPLGSATGGASGGGGGAGDAYSGEYYSNSYSDTSFEVTLLSSQVAQVDKVKEILNNASAQPSETYSLENKQPYEIKLQQKALQDARLKADSMAKLTGAKVGKVLSISEHSNTDAGSSYDYYNYSNTKNTTLFAAYDVSYELVYPLFGF